MLKLAAIFTDHMVLQRRKPIPVWGTGEAGSEVNVALGSASCRAKVRGDGSWLATLEPMDGSEGLTLQISCGGEALNCADVRLGKVRLAGGQSNMEMKLIECEGAGGQSPRARAECEGGRRAIAQNAGKGVRFYSVPHCATREELPEAEENSRWQICAPETSGELRAVAWFFAEEIARTQRTTVGIIDCCWGGTSVTCWMSREQLASTAAGQVYLDAYAALAGDKSEAQYRREMEAYNAEWSAWNDRVQALRAEKPGVKWEEINRSCGICPWPQPAGWQSPFRPAGLYETCSRGSSPSGCGASSTTRARRTPAGPGSTPGC